MTVVDDETTREDIEEAIGHRNVDAKKCQPEVGNSVWESPWDKAHKEINELLDILESFD